MKISNLLFAAAIVAATFFSVFPGADHLARAQFAGNAGAVITPAPAISPVIVAEAPKTSGGVIQLSAFGWLEPYVDTIVQALLAAGLAWLGKSKYTQWMDQSARDALETFVKNRASSLIADGAVRLEKKSVYVDSSLLFKAASEASTAIPDALKRFGLTPDVVAEKVIDAIPQVPAGAEIIANAHAIQSGAPVPINDRGSAAPEPKA